MNRLLCITLCFAYLLSEPVHVVAYDPNPRWGQATVLINDALFVHGGKTDQYNSYSYSSAPTNADLLFLPLSSAFDVSSPPWQLINSSSSQGPAVAWHTLSAFNTSGVLLFGGQPGPNSPTVLVDRSDSASLLNVQNQLDPEWAPEVASWAGQPLRRMHHSTVTIPSGLVFIIGGEKADGSNIAYSDNYVFDRAGPSFTLLPVNNGPPGVCGHASIILPDGRLFVIGGYSQPQATLLPFSTIFIVDTTKSNLSWSTVTTSNSSLPPPRRAFAATLLSDGRILIHGGSDAVLQNNLDDGWILDTSQNPMVWTQVSALSQLGARREHFAISFGSQVIFGFGYGTNAAAPAALQIFDLDKGSFASSFSPLPPSSTRTGTLPGPLQTSSLGTGTHGTGTHGEYPTTTAEPHPGSSGNGGSNHTKQTAAIAVGVVFGFLGLVVAALVVYYLRQRPHRTRSGRRFMALNGGDDGDDGDGSAHSEEGIPAARFFDDPVSRDQHRWGVGLLDTIGLVRLLRSATGGTVRHIPERRDMFADEDREFGEWYGAGRRDGSGGSVWSLRSVLGARDRIRQPSASSTLGEGIVRREKSDPFSDEAALMRDGETAYIPLPVTRTQGRRQISSSTRDYVQAEQLDGHFEDKPLASQSVSSKQPSQNPLIITQDHASNTASSFSASLSPETQSSSSKQTSSTSTEHLHSPGPLPSSIIGSTSSPSIRRSDSWWARFSHTGFLDRRVTDGSRRSSGVLDIRDPNPRPQLVVIEESTHSSSLDYEQRSRLPSESPDSGQFLSKNPFGMYDAHNKSMTSVRTADTEMIEKMAGAIDVVQRSRTNGTTDSTTSFTDNFPLDIASDHLGEEKDNSAAGNEETVPFTSSPVIISYPEPLGRSSEHSQPQSSFITKIPLSFSSPPSPGSSITSLASSPQPRVGAGVVASRIREYERRMSLDQEAPSPTNTRQREERLRKQGASVAVNYGLVQRPSLFIANPDGRMTPSGD